MLATPSPRYTNPRDRGARDLSWRTAVLLFVAIIFLSAFFAIGFSTPESKLSPAHLSIVLVTPLALCACLALDLLLMTYLIACWVMRFANRRAAAWSAPLQPYLHVAVNDQPEFPGDQEIDGCRRKRLLAQYAEIQGRMLHHIEITAEFFANYYMAINMVSIMGAVAGICLLFMGSKGWEKASPYVETLWVYTTVMAAYYLSLIVVFRQQDNISDNKALYLRYVALGNELLTYCATGTSNVTPSETTEEFILRMDEQMARINNIAIGFDYTKIVNYRNILTTSLPSHPQTEQPQPPRAVGEARAGRKRAEFNRWHAANAKHAGTNGATGHVSSKTASRVARQTDAHPTGTTTKPRQATPGESGDERAGEATKGVLV